jgi:hypothetical protein
VGTAVFNTLGVAACIGLAVSKVKNYVYQSELLHQSNDLNLFFFKVVK